jgi:phosphoserine phosphatase RsbU/P
MGADAAAALRGLDEMLEVTLQLATPFDLHSMLAAVTAAARQVMQADRCSVWLYDPATDELVLEVASDIGQVRLPLGTGLVGQCARDRAVLHVPDCYADPRFDPATDQRSGYRTHDSLALPLLDHDGSLVGVLQMLNRAQVAFGPGDERLARALAAQCAVALQRARATEALVQGATLRRELDVARQMQMATLPAAMPALPGYDCHGLSRPATQTGGDTFDLAMNEGELLVVLADATGHGIGPALSVTQMHAMLRMALRLGAGLEVAVQQLNNQLAETLADDRFITAFIGLLDPASGRLRYISAGQGPILHWQAAEGACAQHGPSSFPLGALLQARPVPARHLHLQPGDLLLLLSDGIYETADAAGTLFGRQRVEDLAATLHAGPMRALCDALLARVQAFAGGAPQDDDITVVLVRRLPLPALQRHVAQRRIDALESIFDFSARCWAAHGLPPALQMAVDFVLEELFTNMVKYGGGAQPIEITLRVIPNGIEAVIEDPDADPFDPAAVPDADVSLPAAQREAGGLGLHLIRRMVDSIEHRYTAADRRSRFTFTKTQAPSSAGDAPTEERHAGDGP